MPDRPISPLVLRRDALRRWALVIVETTDLPTKFVKIVVTDDQGQYVVPDLPAANYDVWVRGYGLVDSPKVQTEPTSTSSHRAKEWTVAGSGSCSL